MISSLLVVRVKSLEDVLFPIEEDEINGYNVVRLPDSIRDYFDNQDYDVVTINSREIAHNFPNFGGSTPSPHSLLPHQDHMPDDIRRYLALSKTDDSIRGSQTYVVSKEVVEREIEVFMQYFNDNIDILRKEFVYNPSSKITKEQALKCFEGELDEVAREYLGEDRITEENLTFARAGLLGYLIQGEHANRLAEEFVDKYKDTDHMYIHKWDKPGMLIIDNSKVFHVRIGDNTNPIKRNWLI